MNPLITTETNQLNDVLKIENVGKLAYFFSLKHSYNEHEKNYTINYCTSFYIDNIVLINGLKNGGVYVTALTMLDSFLHNEPEFCNVININDDHLLQIFTYFFNTIKK